ncbi:hypothetical protein [Pseudoalteromonas denitrificans]|uniref:Uncharacterized protein n=1 Tax=Pseudoalteromonas denitrificans DSM 6059 TaxID=1123010 RepID=A0A1I1I6X1_9GAMM|nr:hypothetical protein [Pseudoalteromonas denitrificans]SFC32169.1 hypothetical protein SAMN02745724_01416 [Pseudoalteromonas denitrificans DSM 6059]
MKFIFKFNGYVSNRDAVIKELDLDKNTSLYDLILAAFNKWSLDLNVHLLGDFALILPLNKQLFVCTSAFSSHTIFYQHTAHKFEIYDNTKQFTDHKISAFSIKQLLEWGYILSPNTLFENIFTLNNGQSQLWQLIPDIKQVASKQLTLAHKLHYSEGVTNSTVISNTENNLTSNVFNLLPKLSHILHQPVSANWQIGFLLNMQKSDSHNINIDVNIDPDFHHDIRVKPERFSQKIYRPHLKKQSLNDVKKHIFQLYQQEMQDWIVTEVPSFNTWLALSFKLPSKWNQQRLIAQAMGKNITFIYPDATLFNKPLNIKPPQNKDDHKSEKPVSFFNFEDESIVNIFDAMQRLMHHGFKPVTHKLFHIVPPISAKLIKQHSTHAKQVEKFCYLSLTLDHLARHSNWSVS